MASGRILPTTSLARYGSLSFWVDAVYTAMYIINRLPSLLLQGKSPFELLFSCVPDYSLMRVFGCACYPNLSAFALHKLAPRSKQFFLVMVFTTKVIAVLIFYLVESTIVVTFFLMRLVFLILVGFNTHLEGLPPCLMFLKRKFGMSDCPSLFLLHS